MVKKGYEPKLRLVQILQKLQDSKAKETKSQRANQEKLNTINRDLNPPVTLQFRPFTIFS